MTDGWRGRLALTGEIELGRPEGERITLSKLEFTSEGPLTRPTANFRAALGAATLGELRKIVHWNPRTAELLASRPAGDDAKKAEIRLIATSALLARIAKAGEGLEEMVEPNALLSNQPWCEAAFSFGDYDVEALSVTESEESWG